MTAGAEDRFEAPAGTIVEIYQDLPEAPWPRDGEGNLAFRNDRFDIDDHTARTEVRHG